MIDIIYAELVESDGVVSDAEDIWVCWLEITQAAQAWMLPATAPGDLLEDELQAYFDARETELWQIADAKQYALDIYEWLEPRRVLKAFAGVMLDEINVLRGEQGMPLLTAEDWEGAIREKLDLDL
jgi:hypothetical protein